MTSNTMQYDTTPWYRQFWPWFLISLPGSVVIAGLAMVVIAFKHADSTVNDQYYKDGLAINQVIAQDQVAIDLQISAELNWDKLSGEVLVDLAAAELPQTLTLLLQHPTDHQRDQSIELTSVLAGQYRADIDVFPQHRYYVRLTPYSDPQWRLQGEVDFGRVQQLVLGAQ